MIAKYLWVMLMLFSFFSFINLLIPFFLSTQLPPKNKRWGIEAPVILKRQSILQARFARSCKGRGETSIAEAVAIADDDESDEDNTIEIETGIQKQESVWGVCGTDEELDEDYYYNHDEDAYTGFNARSEKPDDLDIRPGFASDNASHVSVEQVPNKFSACFIFIFCIACCMF